MRKSLKLIPALCMLLISAMLVGTSTYAWFSMNTQVTATGMQVKAVAEDGILISNADKASWTNSATAKVTTAVLVPVSTAGTATPAWAHATSTNADDAQANQEVAKYTDLTLNWTNTNAGEGYVDTDGTAGKSTNEKSYVLLNDFYIKSSGNALTLGDGQTYADLYINEVTVTGATNKIDNSLRVLIVVGSNGYIYAPVSGVGATTDPADPATATLTYKFKNTTSVSALPGTTKNQTTGTTSIGNTDATAVNAKVYVYFEGEDANCKSTNISGVTTTDLSVEVKFGITTVS